jgi:hypothetical protein
MTSLRHRAHRAHSAHSAHSAHRALLAPLAACVLLLGACSAGGGDGADGAADDADTVAQETRDDASDGKDDGKDEPADGAESPESDAGCLEGTWLTDPESIAAVAVASLGPDVGAYSPEVTVTGDALVTFADGTVRTEYIDQAAVVDLVVDGQAIRSVSRGSGIVVGSYTATSTEIVQSGLDTSGLTMVIETYIDGALQPTVPGMVEDYLAATEVGGTSTYTCTADELITTPVVAGIDTTGFDTRLVRQ